MPVGYAVACARGKVDDVIDGDVRPATEGYFEWLKEPWWRGSRCLRTETKFAGFHEVGNVLAHPGPPVGAVHQIQGLDSPWVPCWARTVRSPNDLGPKFGVVRNEEPMAEGDLASIS